MPPNRRPGVYWLPIREPYASFQSLFKWGFISINGLVYFFWARAADEAQHGSTKLLAFMQDHFLLSLRNLRAGRWWTYITNALSHQSLDHLFANMLAFYNYIPLALRFGLQPLELVLLSLGSAVAGSAACVTHWRREGIYRASALGASGLIWGLGMAVTMSRPYTKVVCPPLPMDIPLWMFTLGCFSYDFFGLGSRHSRVGHAAHLGGMAFGAAYYFVRSQLRKAKK